MTKKVITTEKAPQAIGPYSAGIQANGFVYTSGQLGMDPQSGNFVEGGVEAETKRALENLSAVLEAGGSDLDHVIKTTVFLRDMNDFAKMNGVYETFFGNQPPARSAVQVAALPKGAAVEIEAVAIVA
jgi:2-iminobutanoate/2-iminopropanoate deaminase